MAITQQELGGTGAAVAASGNVSLLYPPQINGPLRHGDLAIITVAHRDLVSISLPSDWTLGDSISPAGGTTAFTASWWWKRLDGHESGTSVVVTHAAGDVISGRMHVYRGVKLTGLPYGSKSEFSSTINSTTVTGTGITTTADNSMVVFTGGFGDDSNVSGFTGGIVAERFDHITTTGLDTAIFMANGIKTTAGATGNQGCTQVRTTSYCTFVIELLSEEEIDRTPVELELFSIYKKIDLVNSASKTSPFLIPKANALLVYAELSSTNTTNPFTHSISGGSLTWTNVLDLVNVSNNRRLTIWWAVTGATEPAPFQVTNTYGGVSDNTAISIFEFHGQDLISPIVQNFSSTDSAGTSYTQTLPSSAQDSANRSLAVIGNLNINGGMTADGNTTELIDLFTNNSPNVSMFVGWSDLDFEQTLGASWAVSSERIGAIIEIKSAFPNEFVAIAGFWGIPLAVA